MLHFVGAFKHYGVLRSLLGASTIYFLFISGYLCQFLEFKKRTSVISFYTKKLKNVICPYVVCSLVTCIIMCIIGGERYLVFSMDNFSFSRLFKGLIFGSMQYQYWYIPFVSILFLVSPVFIRMSDRMLLGAFMISACCLVCFPVRGQVYPVAWPNTFYLYSYFTGFYLLGFVYARRKCLFDVYLKRYFIINLFFAILLAVLLQWQGLFSLTLVSADLAIAMQRFFTLCVVLVVLQKIHRKIFVLDLFAKYSFTLFFLHMFFIQDFLNAANRLSGPYWEIVLCLVYIAIVLVVSILLKSALGRNSRIYIGS